MISSERFEVSSLLPYLELDSAIMANFGAYLDVFVIMFDILEGWGRVESGRIREGGSRVRGVGYRLAPIPSSPNQSYLIRL